MISLETGSDPDLLKIGYQRQMSVMERKNFPQFFNGMTPNFKAFWKISCLIHKDLVKTFCKVLKTGKKIVLI